MNRYNNLADIYYHTVEYCRKIKLPVYKPIKYDYINDIFTDDKILSLYKPFDESPIIFVDNIDSFEMARKMSSKDNLVMVLNLASDHNSGGGVARGAKAQEEDLYRKSNYFEANSRNLYPLFKTQVIYSPIVHIIKDQSYKLLDKPCQVSCLAVAALRNPQIISSNDISKINQYTNPIDRQTMQDKIDMIFKVAIMHGHTDIVLGALGCGAFKNPCDLVATMFKKSLDKYCNYFKRIGFAILSGHGNDNYETFKNIITSSIITNQSKPSNT